MDWTLIEDKQPPACEFVTIRTEAGREFCASWAYDSDDRGGYFISWAAADESEAPPCWTDGVCWAENAEGKPSDPVRMWKP